MGIFLADQYGHSPFHKTKMTNPRDSCLLSLSMSGCTKRRHTIVANVGKSHQQINKGRWSSGMILA